MFAAPLILPKDLPKKQAKSTRKKKAATAKTAAKRGKRSAR